MRITQVLNRQHLGFMFKKHWIIQGKRVPKDTGAEAGLAARGVTVTDPNKYIKAPPTILSKVDIIGYLPKVIPEDETHPLWNDKSSFIYKDENVVLEGMSQAQMLTKTVHITNLPGPLKDSYDKTKIPENINISMREAVLMSHILDAEQKKTAIIKDPLRPAFIFPRNYGVTDSRKNTLIISKLLLHCERMAGRIVTSQRKIFNDAYFVFPFERDGALIQMEVTAETMITSRKPIQNFEDKTNYDALELPNLFPIKSTISIPTHNIYEKRNIFPISLQSNYGNVHTIFLHYSPLYVKNLTEIPVSETQKDSRNLLKAFTVAAAKARSLYGEKVQELPKPIIVQSIQTDGKTFNFGVYKLRTLNLNGDDGIKNWWYSIPNVDLFSECLYKDGKPFLGDYNPDVLKLMKVFYNNS